MLSSFLKPLTRRQGLLWVQVDFLLYLQTLNLLSFPHLHLNFVPGGSKILTTILWFSRSKLTFFLLTKLLEDLDLSLGRDFDCILEGSLYSDLTDSLLKNI